MNWLKKIYIKLRSDQPEMNVKLLNSGFVVCSGCARKFGLKFHTPLRFARCSKCGNVTFIPYLVNKYWLFKPLGSGGMGSVYKAIHIENGKLYSVKIAQRHKKNDVDIGRSLIKEGEVGLIISDHSNLCKVIECGKTENEIYMVSEFIDGERLDTLVTLGKKFNEMTVLSWGIQILSALQYIYDCGYLYRDLKPQNLILCSKLDIVKIIDFGLCMEVNTPVSENGIIEGSPQYFPPERCSFEKEGVYSEIYSLGMVLFFCLAGEPYYKSVDVMELLKQHVRQLRIKTITDRLLGINIDVVNLIEKMTKRNPKERYQTFEEVRNEMCKIRDKL